MSKSLNKRFTQISFCCFNDLSRELKIYCLYTLQMVKPLEKEVWCMTQLYLKVRLKFWRSGGLQKTHSFQINPGLPCPGLLVIVHLPFKGEIDLFQNKPYSTGRCADKRKKIRHSLNYKIMLDGLGCC